MEALQYLNKASMFIMLASPLVISGIYWRGREIGDRVTHRKTIRALGGITAIGICVFLVTL